MYMICEKCGKEFTEDWRRNKNTRRTPCKFCSRTCTNSHTKSHLLKLKISSSLKNFYIKKGRVGTIYSNCIICGNQFEKYRSNNIKCCSKECTSIYRIKLTEFERVSRYQYRYLCKFIFNVYVYPEEFDLKLLKDNGWYSAKNRGNNLQGVSRDHLYSISEGYKNSISPLVIRHPANCRLVLHLDNQKKYRNSIISYEELLKRIDIWNEKYYTINGTIGKWSNSTDCKSVAKASSVQIGLVP
jgi:hypothetical protein